MNRAVLALAKRAGPGLNGGGACPASARRTVVSAASARWNDGVARPEVGRFKRRGQPGHVCRSMSSYGNRGNNNSGGGGYGGGGGSGTFVSSYYEVNPDDITALLLRKNLKYRHTSEHLIVRDCPFCSPTGGKADNLFKLYIQRTGGGVLLPPLREQRLVVRLQDPGRRGRGAGRWRRGAARERQQARGGAVFWGADIEKQRGEGVAGPGQGVAVHDEPAAAGAGRGVAVPGSPEVLNRGAGDQAGRAPEVLRGGGAVRLSRPERERGGTTRRTFGRSTCA